MSDHVLNPSLPAGFFAAPPVQPPNVTANDMLPYTYGNSQQSRTEHGTSQILTYSSSSYQQSPPTSYVAPSSKRPRDEPAFHCDACNLSLDSRSALQAHVTSHTTCSQCSFTAAPKLVKAHYEAAHGRFAGSGFKTVTVAVPGCPVQRFCICVGNNPNDIQQWIQERKRRFPRRNKVELLDAVPSAPIQEEPTKAASGVAALLAGYSSSDASDEETDSKVPAVATTAAPLLPPPTSAAVGVDAPLNEPTRKRGVCRFFARNGTCRNGDACAYSHDIVANQRQSQLSLPRDRSKETLLGKLLSNDVKRERSLTIQLLEYLVQSDFLEKKVE